MKKLVETLTLLTIVVSFVTVSAFLLDGDNTKTVQTKYGDIVGQIKNAQFDGRDFPVARFLGIPYAEPPVGDLRFRKPVPVKTLISPFMADKFGNTCIQFDTGDPHGTLSENCLFLNIFAPANSGNAGVPLKAVMVWFHGGGFVFGESNTYEGDVISGYGDVIIVTINYRLGPFGFFSTHDDNARGNYGLWDQHEAIRWVHDNIQAFGGDKNNVTIFGESAGGASVYYQLMYPGNGRLFERSIIESGALAPWGYTTKDRNLNASVEFAYALGCNYTSTHDMMLCIRSKSSKEVTKAFYATLNTTTDFKHPTWVPVNDGEFLDVEPSTLLRELLGNDPNKTDKYHSFFSKDLIIGVNSYDGAVVLPFLFGISDPDITYSADKLRQDTATLLEYLLKRPPTVATINAVLQYYTNVSGSDNYLDVLIRASSDSVYFLPAVLTAYARAQLPASLSDTYLYEFSVTPPGVYNPLPAYLQHDRRAANHIDEVMYVFGFPAPIARGLYNISGPKDPADIEVAKFMMTAWTNFAKSGKPAGRPGNGPASSVTWPLYRNTQDQLPQRGQLPYLDISKTMSRSSSQVGLAENAIAFWTHLLPNQFSG